MNKAELFAKIDSTWLSAKRKQELKAAVEEYLLVLIATKPIVSGSLPPDDSVSKDEYDKAISEIERLQDELSKAEDYIEDLSRGYNH